MSKPDWAAIATRELSANDRADERIEIVFDRFTSAVMRAHRLMRERDPELAAFFLDMMMRAFGSGK